MRNYRLEDFKIVENENTDIYERIVSVDLSKIKELPVIIVQRLETLINRMIEDHEQEHNVNIPLENMELGMHMDIDTQEQTLYLGAYVGYSIDEDCIVGKEVMTAADEDYYIIKKYFFSELNNCVLEQIKRIEGCLM